MKKYRKLKKGIVKRVKANNAPMLSWLILPIFALFFVTNYFFQKPNENLKQVLGASTNISINTESSVDSREIIKQKFDNFEWSGKGVVSIIFTGAYKNQFDIAYPELSSKGISAGVSVPTQDIQLGGNMTWLNIRFLQFKGWEIISQSKKQICDKDKLNDLGVIEDEVIGSKKVLSDYGIEVNLYLSPCGVSTPEVSSAVEKNYNGFLKFGIQTNSASSPDAYNLIIRQVDNTINPNNIEKWIKYAKANKTWLIVSFPDISDKEDINSVSYDLFTKSIDQIIKSGMQVALPGEIIKYDK